MKRIYSNFIIPLLLITFMFTIKVGNVDALTCEYEMYPVNYSNKDGEVLARGDVFKTIAKTKYTTTSKDDYSLEHITTFGGDNNHTFAQNSFNNEVWKNKTSDTVSCPYYIKVKKNFAEVLTKDEFINEQDTFMTSINRENIYPMVLVKQDGKMKSEPVITSMSRAFSMWSQIISNSNSYVKSNGCSMSSVNAETYNMSLTEFVSYASRDYNNRNNNDKNMTEECWNARKNYVNMSLSAQYYYEQLNNSTVAKINMSEAQNYTTFKNFISTTAGTVTAEQKQKEKEEELDKIMNDYCYLYCDTMVCTQTNSTAQNECSKSCSATTKPKCEKAYDSCKNIQSSTDRETCLENSFSNFGLNYNEYSKKRNSRIDEVQEEIKKTKTQIAQNLKIEFTPYKLNCDDVVILHDLWIIITIIGPVITIAMGILDFAKATVAGDSEKISKAWKKFPKRLLACVILILIPVIISIIVNISNDENVEDTSLMYCIINGGE